MSYQKIIVAGNLGRDPEMRYTPSGQAVTNLSIATNRRWTGADGQPQEETIWFRVSAWGKRAEICNQYLSKGSGVIIEGRLSPDRRTGEPRIWTDQQGTPRASYEITAENVTFFGGKGNETDSSFSSQDDYQSGGDFSSSSQSSSPPANSPDNSGGIQEDEIPF